MNKNFIVIALILILGTSQVLAADRVLASKLVEKKAEVLEERSAASGKKLILPPSASITPVEVQKVDPAGGAPLDDAITCLARTIYWEAKNEGRAGTEAVANVVMNRLGHEGFPKTICEVVRQGSEQSPCQFSWWCDGRSDSVQEDDIYAMTKEVARKALNQQLSDRTDGALYFHHQKMMPAWAASYVETARIGQHVFYKPRGGAAR